MLVIALLCEASFNEVITEISLLLTKNKCLQCSKAKEARLHVSTPGNKKAGAIFISTKTNVLGISKMVTTWYPQSQNGSMAFEGTCLIYTIKCEQ